MTSASGTQTKLLGTASAALRKRLTANWIKRPIRTSHGICDSAQSSNQAQITIATGHAMATASCQAAGSAVCVRRGMSVRRKPAAKQVMKPSICAKA